MPHACTWEHQRAGARACVWCAAVSPCQLCRSLQQVTHPWCVRCAAFPCRTWLACFLPLATSRAVACLKSLMATTAVLVSWSSLPSRKRATHWKVRCHAVHLARTVLGHAPQSHYTHAVCFHVPGSHTLSCIHGPPGSSTSGWQYVHSTLFFDTCSLQHFA